MRQEQRGIEKPQPLVVLTPKELDYQVNALLRAITEALGRKPFVAHTRNVRSVVRKWCPLLQASELSHDAFRGSYVPAHLLDRYFYSSELGGAQSLEDQAFESFKENLVRGLGFTKPSPSSWLGGILASAARMLDRILGPFELEELFESSHHGPKSAIGVKLKDAFLDRKVSTLTGTSEALALYKEYLDWNSTQNELYALDAQFTSEACGISILQAADAVATPSLCRGNKLSFVPKSYCKLRTMMIEPVINQFFQLGLGEMLSRRLKRSCNIDLSSQPDCHRRLCHVITRHNLPIATLDWSQASDRIWLGLVKRLFPSDWFVAITSVRSPFTNYGGLDILLTMVGSMGCGFTFPLQTLVFYVLLLALKRETDDTEHPGVFPEDCFVSVFGDDCIVDSDLVPHVERLAAELDWKLNMDKSFWDGPFRESCGVDSYRGMDVRPFFIDRPSETDLESGTRLQGWAYGCHNLAVKACGVAPTSPPLVEWLENTLELLGAKRVYVVPPRWGERSGVRIESPSVNLGLKRLPQSAVQGSDTVGYAFKCLDAEANKVKANAWPYYLDSLRKVRSDLEEEPPSTPLSYEKAGKYGDCSCPSPPFDRGRVKGHEYMVRKREFQILTWNYWIDP